MIRSCLVCIALLAMSRAADAGSVPEPLGGPRIRPQDSRAAKFLTDGLRRSATLRALADRIEDGDVIVYVGVKPLMKSNLSGALSFVTTAGDFRYVRVSISADQVPDLIIATLAHELQHVIEVIENPSVTNDASLSQLYQRIGLSTNHRPSVTWETLAAQAMGNQVRREIGHATATETGVAAAEVEFGVRRYSRDL
jgi:hypothetical protein